MLHTLLSLSVLGSSRRQIMTSRRQIMTSRRQNLTSQVDPWTEGVKHRYSNQTERAN